MTKIIIAAFAVFFSTGCAYNSPSVQYYVLESNQQARPNTTPSMSDSVGIGPITLPELLRNKKIVTRNVGNTVKIAEFHQWASSLEDSILNALTGNLTSLQPNRAFHAYPWTAYGMVDKQIIIDITRFDTTPGISANLEAHWTIKNEADHAVLTTGRSALNQRLPEKSYPATVKALTQLLASFSRELSLALLQTELKR